MDVHEYVIEHMVRERLHEARSTTARRALVSASRAPRPTFRARLGNALIALGERLAGPTVSLRPSVAPGTVHR